jgi:hypothetical protein
MRVRNGGVEELPAVTTGHSCWIAISESNMYARSGCLRHDGLMRNGSVDAWASNFALLRQQDVEVTSPVLGSGCHPTTEMNLRDIGGMTALNGIGFKILAIPLSCLPPSIS